MLLKKKVMMGMEKKLNKVLIGSAIAGLFLYKFLNREVERMLDLYVGLVSRQRRTCNPDNKKVRQVPGIWREAVIEDLKALGLDSDGMPVDIDA